MDFKFTGMDGDGDKLSSPRSSLTETQLLIIALTQCCR